MKKLILLGLILSLTSFAIAEEKEPLLTLDCKVGEIEAENNKVEVTLRCGSVGKGPFNQTFMILVVPASNRDFFLNAEHTITVSQENE